MGTSATPYTPLSAVCKRDAIRGSSKRNSKKAEDRHLPVFKEDVFESPLKSGSPSTFASSI